MAKFYLIIFVAVFSFKPSFSQCTLFISGSDFVWCQPCDGSASTVVTSGAPPYSYVWSTGDTTANISSLCSGTYTLTVSDSNGCIMTDSVTINQIGSSITAINLSSSAATCSTCCDACVYFNPIGGCTPYTYSWLPSDPNWPSPCFACPFQTYSLTVTDACGCSLTDSITPDTVSIGTGVQTINHFSGIVIYPNPSSELLNLKTGLTNELLYVSISDISGNIVLKTDLKSAETKIYTNHLATGIYFITIRNDKQIFLTEKWIKTQ